ncbi:hypothetical protein LEN26_006666 [Aphanomyces euteiches]|nr:hypothetical protein AeMF1_010811 [Aphanomyces euteiches]KAH9134904.1 hypothetical protein LEN26_006666 [Aphanomyces euteiches]KAH9187867.1 hypothetical protein AeNC1_010161 [Aphanomyces euteiches]
MTGKPLEAAPSLQVEDATDTVQTVLVRSHRFALYKYSCLIQCFRVPAQPSTNAFLMVFYSLGLVVCFGAYAYVLERLTIDGHGPNEIVLMLVCCVIYAILSYAGKMLARELVDTAPWYVFVLLSFTTFCSTFLSTYSLRFVSYIFRVLGKTCKPIPIMMIGLLLGKRYPLRKYISVALVTLGAILFFIYQSKTSHKHVEPQNNSTAALHVDTAYTVPHAEIGALLLLISLFFDGATGALEEKYMTQYQMGAFTMMHKINVVSAAFALGLILATSQEETLFHMVDNLSASRDLLLLGISGGFGQMFIFLMISRFGALMTSVAGTARKILTLCVSILAFGHVLTSMQYFGLGIAIAGMCINLWRGSKPPLPKIEADEEAKGLLQVDDDDDSSSHEGDDEEIYENKLPDEPPNAVVFHDVRESLVAKEDDYGMAIDIAFRATTAV